MTDYSKLSDFEINKRVCDVFWPDFSKSSECKNKTFQQNSSVVYVENSYGGFSRDYCNNPADAWPIIVDNGISLECIVVNRHEKTWRAQFKPAYVKHHMNDKNPLRAAMIVFLMMQEKKE